jgi:hypothetical protein
LAVFWKHRIVNEFGVDGAAGRKRENGCRNGHKFQQLHGFLNLSGRFGIGVFGGKCKGHALRPGGKFIVVFYGLKRGGTVVSRVDGVVELGIGKRYFVLENALGLAGIFAKKTNGLFEGFKCVFKRGGEPFGLNAV